MILVSACLIGVDCRYNGGNNKDDKIIKLMQERNIVPVCPEQLGGLSTPRMAAEIQGGDGSDVLDKKTKVITKDRVDVTKEFIKGAKEILKIAEGLGINKAILKARSPSCGMGEIYDGSFTGTIVGGDGVTSALLKRKGIEVYTEESHRIIDLFDR